MTTSPDTRRHGLGRRLRSSLLQAVQGAGSAVQRFPVAVLCLAAMGIGVNARIADIAIVPEALQGRIMETLGAAVFFNIALTLLIEQRPLPSRRILLASGLTIPLAVLAYAWRPFDDAGYVWQSAAALSIFALPFAGRGRVGPWNLLLRSFAAAALAGFATLAFLSGGILLAELFRLLFDIGPTWEAYAHVVATAVCVVGPLATLGLLPQAATERASARIVRPMRSFLSLVLAPMLIAALIVLHLYALRVAIEGLGSQVDMAWIVPVLTVNLWLVRILADPMEGPPHLDLIRRFWPFALIVPVILFVPALWHETARGWTEGVYYAALLVAAGVCVGLVQILKRWRSDLRLFFAVPAVLLLASLIGPWGTASMLMSPPVGRASADLPQDVGPAITARTQFGPFASESVDVTGFDRVLPVVSVMAQPVQPTGSAFTSRFDGPVLVLAAAGRERRFDLAAMLASLRSRPDQPLAGALTSDDGVTIGYALRFLTLAGEEPETGEFTLLLRQADWR